MPLKTLSFLFKETVSAARESSPFQVLTAFIAASFIQNAGESHVQDRTWRSNGSYSDSTGYYSLHQGDFGFEIAHASPQKDEIVVYYPRIHTDIIRGVNYDRAPQGYQTSEAAPLLAGTPEHEQVINAGCAIARQITQAPSPLMFKDGAERARQNAQWFASDFCPS